ncbi:MAG: DUF885 domain-containing protein [Alphaproteobacteria bacterium]
MSAIHSAKTIFILISSAFFLAACGEPEAPAPEQSLTDFLTEVTYDQFRDSPEAVSQLGISIEEIGFKTSHLLDDRSPEAEAKGRADFVAGLEVLKGYNREDLSADEQLYYDITMATVNDALPMLDMPGPFSPTFPSIYRMSQLAGPHLGLPQILQSAHPVTNIEEAEDFIARLNAVNDNFAGFLEAWNADIEAGLIPPKFGLEKASATLANFLSDDPKTSPFYGIFAGKVGALEDLSDAAKADLLARAEAAIVESVNPGYAALKARVDELIPEASWEAGVWAKPGGEAYYKVATKIFSGTDFTPEQIHQIGLDEVTRILAERERILVEAGLTEGTQTERIQTLVANLNLVFTNDDEGREGILQYLADNKAFMTENAPDYFAVIPETDFDIQRIPAFSEASAPGGYYTPPTLDGSRPGIFWINLRDPSQANIPSLKSLLYHEAVPGHHFELAQALTATDRPIFRRLFFSSNYSEGWALYAELLAEEMGAYENDPVGNLGRLGSELFRAARLVVDTGMHAKKWSREDALKFMVDTYNAPEAAFVSEIERYAVWPGQALGYKMGMLKIVELREKARAAIGDDFDIKVFHQLILGEGSMPMSVVEKRVNDWIAANAG